MLRSQTDDSLIKKYELAYQSGQDTKVFASLADMYRKAGFLEKALRICQSGISEHQNFANGFLVLAKIYLDLKYISNAVKALNRVIRLSPESLIAHKMLAEIYLRQAEMSNALKLFEKVLLISPYDERAKAQVLRIKQVLSTDEDQFKMKKLTDLKASSSNLNNNQVEVQPASASTPAPSKNTFHQILDRYLSLADAYMLRSNIQKALDTLNEAEDKLGHHPELTRRLTLLSSRLKINIPNAPASIKFSTERKIEILENVLNRIQKNAFSFRD